MRPREGFWRIAFLVAVVIIVGAIAWIALPFITSLASY